MVKIESKVLKEYVEKVTLKGKINEIEMSFEEEGVVVRSKTLDNTNMVLGKLKKSAFHTYNTSNKVVGIKNSVLLLDLLESFTKTISLDITENLLSIYTDKKNANITLVKPEFIVDTKYPEEVDIFEKFDEGVNLSSEIFRNSVRNSNILKSSDLSIVFEENILKITSGEKNFDNIEEKLECSYKNVRSVFGEPVKNIVELLPEKINFSIMENNAPAQFKIQDEKFDIVFLAAPYSVEEEYEEPKTESQETEGEIL